ncbi:hypothetical protein [Paracoccus beibuensis]|uniref:hypothetical protein n=1 Tax=Paracoccus beibuensis TaxID=547602 RepID=UPI002240A07E|nr:hypothetical protein [Paracoccus beibuensis]
MVTLTGRVWDIYQDEGHEAEEGDVWLQSKLDSAGRAAVAGRHANNGYSGWFAGFIHADGARRKFLGWRILFPDFQNGFERQGDKGDTVFRIEECLKALGDLEIVKVKGGYGFADEAEAERRVNQHWEDWNAPRKGMTREEAQEHADRRNASRKTRRIYTAEDILAEKEPEFEKRMRLRGNRPFGLASLSKIGRS